MQEQQQQQLPFTQANASHVSWQALLIIFTPIGKVHCRAFGLALSWLAWHDLGWSSLCEAQAIGIGGNFGALGRLLQICTPDMLGTCSPPKYQLGSTDVVAQPKWAAATHACDPYLDHALPKKGPAYLYWLTRRLTDWLSLKKPISITFVSLTAVVSTAACRPNTRQPPSRIGSIRASGVFAPHPFRGTKWLNPFRSRTLRSIARVAVDLALKDELQLQVSPTRGIFSSTGSYGQSRTFLWAQPRMRHQGRIKEKKAYRSFRASI